jgi:hypothetical protein
MPGGRGFEPQEMTPERIAAILAAKAAANPRDFKAAASGEEANLETKQALRDAPTSSVFGSSGVENIIKQQKINADGSQTNTKTTSFLNGSTQKIIDSTPSGAAGKQDAGVQNNSGFTDFIDTPIMRGTPFDWQAADNFLEDTAAFANKNKIPSPPSSWDKTWSNVAGVAGMGFPSDPDFGTSISDHVLNGIESYKNSMERSMSKYNEERKNSYLADVHDQTLSPNAIHPYVDEEKPFNNWHSMAAATENFRNMGRSNIEVETENNNQIVADIKKVESEIADVKENPNFSNFINERRLKAHEKELTEYKVELKESDDKLEELGVTTTTSLANKKLDDVTPPKFSSDDSGLVGYKLDAFPTVKIDGKDETITGKDTDAIDLNKIVNSIIKNPNHETTKGSVGSAVKKVIQDEEALTALQILQDKVDSYVKSPELIATELDQFMRESGYLVDVDAELHKGVMMFAAAIAMGSNLSQAMSASFGQLAYEDEQQQIQDQANKDRMMDLLKTNGKFMTPASWKAALDSMPLSKNDKNYLDILQQTSSAEATETAAAEYLGKVQKFEKELVEMVHIKTGDGKNTSRIPAFREMMHQVNIQMTQAGRSKEFLGSITQNELLEAFTDWEDYLAQPAEKESAWWAIWDWFDTPTKKILDPIVFYEGNQGLIGESGSPSIPIDKEDPHYEYILIAQQYNGLMNQNDQDKMDAEESDIYNQWFKEEKGKGGAFSDVSNYPYYFAVEIKKRLRERL